MYIKKNKLNDGRTIKPDAALKAIFPVASPRGSSESVPVSSSRFSSTAATLDQARGSPDHENRIKRLVESHAVVDVGQMNAGRNRLNVGLHRTVEREK